MATDRTTALLEEILKSLQRIELLLRSNSSQTADAYEIDEVKKESFLDVMEIINIVSEIDSNLVPTIKAILSKGGKSSAQDIAIITNRSRSRENQHLNHLVELGYVQKKRDGREIIFSLKGLNLRMD